MSEVVALVGGATKPITRIVLVQGGVAFRVFTRVVALAGGQQVVYTAGGTPTPTPSDLSVSAMPGAVQGSVTSSNQSPKTVYTATAMANASGGTAPYQFMWMKRADDGAATWSVTNPTASSTNFRAGGVVVDTESNAVFYCVVTDATGRSVTSNNVNAAASVNGTQ